MRDVQEGTGGALGACGFKGTRTWAQAKEGDMEERPQSPHTPNPQGLAQTISQPLSPLTSKH